MPAGARIPIPSFCWLVSRMASVILSMRNASVCNHSSLPRRRLSVGACWRAGTRKHVGMQARLLLTSKKRRSLVLNGFTLIELMVAVAMLAILLAIAVPSFRSALAGNRLTASTNDLISAIAAARSEAIRRGGRITLCKSADGVSCTVAGGWEQGWISFTDVTRAAVNPSVDAGETVLLHGQALAPPLLVRGNAGAANFLSFAADGTMRTMAGALQGGRIRVCYPEVLSNSNRARDIEVLATGRLTSTTPGNVDDSCPTP